VEWSILITQPNCENKVCRALKEREYPHYCFKLRQEVVKRGVVVEKFRPAFPRYIFVAANEKWSEIKELAGVYKFIMFGEYVAILSQDMMDAFVQSSTKLTNDELVLIFTEKPSENFSPGTRVRICNGIASGFFGTFQYLIAPDRALVLVDWMGRQVPLSILECNLEKGRRRSPRSLRKRRKFPA
jgi:transcription antitermination factor NusG